MGALSVAGVIVLAALALAGTGSAAVTSASSTQTVRTYLAAMNAKDGAALCDALHPREANAVGYYIAWLFTRRGEAVKRLPCPKAVGMIGSGGTRDNASLWRRAKILHMGAPKPAGHGLVSIDVRMVDYFDDGVSGDARTTRFWLTHLDGRWVIVRRSSALEMAMFSLAFPDGADARPATREPNPDDVQLPAAEFTCSDDIWAKDDPVGDTATHDNPWLDIRRVTLSGSPANCVTVELTGRPLPGTLFQVTFSTRDGRDSEYGDKLAIQADGTIDFTGIDPAPAVAGRDYGLADPTTLVMRFPNVFFQPDTMDVQVEPLSQSEPLIRTQPSLYGGDEVEHS